MSKNTGNMYRNTSFRNGGRKAGYAIYHDDYSEDSGNRDYERQEKVRLPNDDVKPEEPNGPVICIKK